MDWKVRAKLKRHYLIIIIELSVMLGAAIFLNLNYKIIVNFCIAIIGFTITYMLLELQR